MTTGEHHDGEHKGVEEDRHDPAAAGIATHVLRARHYNIIYIHTIIHALHT
jgi:hypothetical protein